MGCVTASRNLYEAYVRVNAVVKTLPPSRLYQFTVSGTHVGWQCQSVAVGTPATTVVRVRFLQSVRLCQHRAMKLVPVVEIVQVHRVFRGRSIIGHAACAQNAASRFVIMIVTAHRRVVLFDRVAI